MLNFNEIFHSTFNINNSKLEKRVKQNIIDITS